MCKAEGNAKELVRLSVVDQDSKVGANVCFRVGLRGGEGLRSSLWSVKRARCRFLKRQRVLLMVMDRSRGECAMQKLPLHFLERYVDGRAFSLSWFGSF